MESNTNRSSNVAEHYNARPNQGIAARESSLIYRLRAFNNWVKAVQIGMHTKPQMSVLDLACGKGGDLGKWDRARIQRYHGIDIAPVSIQHAQERLRDMNVSFKASFESRDAFSLPFTLDFDCDVVSCQFALHYAFKDERTLNQALENISKCLKPDGLFFGTIADGSQIRKMQKYENSVFSIKFANEKWREQSGGVFGIEYTFNLVDAIDNCPEYLSNHMILEAIAETYGLELLYFCPFKEFYMQHAPRNAQMLERMHVVENGRMMLSSDEMQVAELYSAFCFRKIKN